MPIRPSAASFGMSSDGKCCASSHSRTCGRISALGELADALAQKLLLVGQSEVHVAARKVRRVIISLGFGPFRPGKDALGSRCASPACSFLPSLLVAAARLPARAESTAFIGAQTSTLDARLEAGSPRRRAC